MAPARRRRHNEGSGTRIEGEKDARDDPASLSTVSVLGEDSPRARPQGGELALGRDSGLDAASEADADDRRLSPDADPSTRRGILLRYPSDPAGHRGAWFVKEPLSSAPRRNDEGPLLVDREEFVHERGVPDDRQHGWQAASGPDRRASAALRRQP